jgi:hypothetical protein
MKMQLTHLLCACALLVNFVRAEEPATAPSGETAAVLESFKAYNEAMLKGDSAGMLKYNHTATDAVRPMAEAMVAGDVAVGRLLNAVEKAFGADSAKRVGEAVGDIGNDDLAEAKVEIKGDQARVMIGDMGSQRMRKVDGVWKFDLSGATEKQIQESTAALNKRAEGMTAIAEKVASGGIKSFDDLIKMLAENE